MEEQVQALGRAHVLGDGDGDGRVRRDQVEISGTAGFKNSTIRLLNAFFSTLDGLRTEEARPFLGTAWRSLLV